MTAVERVIARARAELGYMEKASNSQLEDKTANAGKKNWNKYAKYLDDLGVYNGKKNGYDWCDCFADYCFIAEFGKELGLKMICQPDKSYGAGVNNSARYYKKEGRLDKNPAVGDQVYFIGNDGLYYHTGLVVAVDDDTVTTIEGNAGSGSTRVVETVYKRSNKRLGAFGHPHWELAGDAPVVNEPEKVESEEKSAETVSLAVGDIIRLNNDATVYGKSYKFSSWVYNRNLYVRAIKGDRITISTSKTGAVTGNVDVKYVIKGGQNVVVPKPETPSVESKPEIENVPTNITLQTGDIVRMSSDATVYGKSYKFSNWVYNCNLYVRAIKGDKITISTLKTGAVTGNVDVKYLSKV